MIDLLEGALGLIVGGLMGALYFAGLWWTVRRLPKSRHVLAVYFGSLLLRLTLALSTIYLLLTLCDWPAWVACFVGFLASRWMLLRGLGQPLAT